MADPLEIVPALTRQLRLRGVLVASGRHQEMIRAIDANGICSVVDRSFILIEIVEAFRYKDTSRHFGKICLEF